MAKIKWGALVTDGRGKLGGHVLSKNRAGSYIRTKVTPVNGRTQAQMRVRAIFAGITSAWSQLSKTQIAAWNAAVDEWQRTDIFGDLVKPTGKNLHQRLNQNAQLANFAPLLVPPIKQDLPENQITKATINITGGQIVFTGLPLAGTGKVIQSGTPAVSRGTTFVKNRLRIFQTRIITGMAQTDSYDAYVLKFGVPEVGDKIFLAVQYVLDTGQVSPMQVLEADIIA